MHLAVSLTATTNELRDRLAPINRRYPLEQLLEACGRLDLGRRRITFEYVMLAGVNDSPADAARLVKLMAPLRAKVNLIFFNPFAGSDFAPSSREAVERFQAILLKGNLTATIRESRGRDIAAACGQLRVEHQVAAHDRQRCTLSRWLGKLLARPQCDGPQQRGEAVGRLEPALSTSKRLE